MMMRDRVDLATELLRETYRNPTKSRVYNLQLRPLTKIRTAIVNAKRFMLDDSMSEFLAELSTAPFNKVANERIPDILESLRHSAIPPFENMFIQLNNRAFRRGLIRAETPWRKTDPWQNNLLESDSDELVSEVGWLIETKEGQSEVMMTEFFQYEGQMATLPFRWVYRTNDLGWSETVGNNPLDNMDTKAGMFAHGIEGFRDPCVAVWYPRPLSEFPDNQKVKVEITGVDTFYVHYTVPEYASTLRYMFAFLATLNNVPKISTEVKQTKGFIGGGQRRKYLDHTILTLNMPAKQTTARLANRLIAQARRGWHIVRSHWRISHPRLNGHYCATRERHIWGVANETGHATCKQCDARRVWIVLPNGRGDPTISVRTHVYNVTH